MYGGAQIHIANLKSALEIFGHEVEIVSFPFKFTPESYLEDLMDYCVKQDFSDFSGYQIDKVIALQFPAYYVQHKNKTLWIMHQHRAVYDLYNTEEATKELKNLKNKICQMDNQYLNTQNTVYANSQNVANRLKKFNNIEATPLYHPPANEELFYCDENYGFIFCPSRIEALKRQTLLIQAMQYTKSNAVTIIAGDGGQLENYRQLAKDLKVSDKVSLIGRFTDEEKYTLYARSLGVFFAPLDEDYGYITLEAMLSSKPVITCTDSGGPLEFVVDEETGFIVEPDPKQIAKKIDWLYNNQNQAQKLGEHGLAHYKSKISVGTMLSKNY
jgi:glycosyltransferase involved in cell wall biosynthesis